LTYTEYKSMEPTRTQCDKHTPFSYPSISAILINLHTLQLHFRLNPGLVKI